MDAKEQESAVTATTPTGWRIAGGSVERFEASQRTGGEPPGAWVAFALPDHAADELRAAARADGADLLDGFVREWQASSELWSRLEGLLADRDRTAAALDAATAKQRSLQSRMDELLYEGRPVEKTEQQLDAAGKEVRAATFRAERIGQLIKNSRAECESAMRLAVEGERQKLAARLMLDCERAAADLSAAAETYVGAWIVASEALRHVRHAAAGRDAVDDAFGIERHRLLDDPACR